MKISWNGSIFSTAQAYFADPELAVSIRSGDTTGSLIKRLLGRVIDVHASLEQLRSTLLVHTAVFKAPAIPAKDPASPSTQKPQARRLAKTLAAQLKEINERIEDLCESFRRIGQDDATARAELRQAMLTPFSAMLHCGALAEPDATALQNSLGISPTGTNSLLRDPSEEQLRDALQARSERVWDFFLADEADHKGLIPSLLGAVHHLQSGLATQLGTTKGMLLDVRA